MTKKKISLLLIMIATIAGAGAWWRWAITASAVGSNQKIKLEIIKGESVQAIGEKLETKGIIRSSLALRIWLKYLDFKGNRAELKAGAYQFLPNQSLEQIVEQLQNKAPVEVAFTIPEGWTIAQMAAYFEQKGFFAASDFIAATKSNLARKPWLPAKISSLEGFLFPDTYQILAEQATPDRVIEKMLSRFEEVALPLLELSQKSSQKSSQKTTDNSSSQSLAPAIDLKKWVIFASIVEKEAVLDHERSIIAGVFWLRLKLGMRLESDPTVEYGLNIKQTVDQPLTLAQVRTPSPYNTYLVSGLPPGPIASPGLKSLRAVLKPQKTGYLFFVARYDGSHIFSRNFTDHQAAIQTISQRDSQKR